MVVDSSSSSSSSFSSSCCQGSLELFGLAAMDLPTDGVDLSIHRTDLRRYELVDPYDLVVIIVQRYLVEGITYDKVPPSSSQTSRVSTKAAELRRKTTCPIRQPRTETCRWNSLRSLTRSLQAAKVAACYRDLTLSKRDRSI